MKKNLGWKIYLIFFSLMAQGNLMSLFDPDAPPYIYYHILCAFSPLLGIFYDLNVTSAVLTVLTIVPMVLFIFEIPWLPPIVWRYFIGLRLVFDVLGRPYELLFFKSLWLDDYRFGLAYLFSLAGLLFPSYLLLFRHAFKNPLINRK